MNTTKSTSKTMNGRKHVLSILQTVQLLKQNHGANYLQRILLGKTEFDFKEGHESLPTFGALAEEHFDKVYRLIYYLVQHEYLEITNTNYGTIGITEKGKDFLHEPQDIWLRPKDLRTNVYDIQLIIKLREIRRNFSKQEAKPSFLIFSDYLLQLIVEHKPTDILSLKKLPGIGDYKADRYGHLIIQAIHEVSERKRMNNQVRRFKQAHAPSHQEVKVMFEAGMGIDEIAEKKQIQPSTVRSYLFNLHEAGQINLLPWIEKEVDGENLAKGKAYFQSVQNPRLKEAYEMLGLDYDTLKLCRLYVSNLATSQADLSFEYTS